LYACAVRGGAEVDPSVEGMISNLEAILAQSRKKDQPLTPNDKKDLLWTVTVYCYNHWVSRLLLLYLCLEKNPKMTHSDWIRYQLNDGRVRFALFVCLFVCLFVFLFVPCTPH
jgi:hypothetical protein